VPVQLLESQTDVMTQIGFAAGDQDTAGGDVFDQAAARALQQFAFIAENTKGLCVLLYRGKLGGEATQFGIKLAYCAAFRCRCALSYSPAFVILQNGTHFDFVR
jgi:hypothetical protein